MESKVRSDKENLLKDEYLHIQGVIEAFDGRVLTIKAWSITFSLSSMGAAFATHSWVILVISALSAMTFWILEGIWKTFQYAHYDRSGKIEKFFAGNNPNIEPMQIGASWNANWRKGGKSRLFKIMFWHHVMLPHALVLVASVLLIVLQYAGVLTI